MDLINIICEGTMKAAAEMIAVKKLTVDTHILVDALREQIKTQYDETLKDLKAAIDAHMGEPMYRQILNVACNKMAVDALKQVKAI